MQRFVFLFVLCFVLFLLMFLRLLRFLVLLFVLCLLQLFQLRFVIFLVRLFVLLLVLVRQAANEHSELYFKKYVLVVLVIGKRIQLVFWCCFFGVCLCLSTFSASVFCYLRCYVFCSCFC